MAHVNLDGLKTPPHLKRPRPQEFGLPASMTADVCKAGIEQREGRLSIIISVAAYVVAFVIIFSINNWLLTEPYNNMMGLGWFAFIGSVPVKVWLDTLYKRFMPDPVAPNIRAFAAANNEFEANVADWNDRQLACPIHHAADGGCDSFI